MTSLLTLAAATTTDGKSGMDMMEDGPSLLLFAVLVTAISTLAVLGLPPLLNRQDLGRAVPALAVIGPILGLVGGAVGGLVLLLTDRDSGYVLIIAAATGVAASVVGLRLASPMARDLDVIGSTVGRVAAGDRSARTGIDRSDEIGNLAAAVDNLARSLAGAEEARRVADDERNAVVSALSHDLRTPLASLLVSVEALQDGIGDSAHHLRAMRGNILALERLVEDLFLLARADAGRLALTRVSIDLGELVDEAVDALSPMAAQRSVNLRSELVEPIMVSADTTALGRVLRNLLDNAVRHSPDAGTVTVSCRRDRAPIGFDGSTPDGSTANGSVPHGARSGADVVVVTVTDEGEGFDDSFRPRALERFTQADDARSRPGGAGLGLAIANTLVAAHGGSVSIAPGPGGAVSVMLPSSDRNSPATAAL